MISEENMGKKLFLAEVAWFGSVRRENHIKGKSTKTQKQFLLATLAESSCNPTQKSYHWNKLTKVASARAPIPWLKITSNENAQKEEEILSYTSHYVHSIEFLAPIRYPGACMATSIRRKSLDVENDTVKWVGGKCGGKVLSPLLEIFFGAMPLVHVISYNYNNIAHHVL